MEHAYAWLGPTYVGRDLRMQVNLLGFRNSFLRAQNIIF